MKNWRPYIFPVFFGLSIIALTMKKFMIPFHGLFLIIVFDGLAVLYFMRAFTSERTGTNLQGRSLNFDLSYLIYAVCSIAILYRLQYWEGWERWIMITGVLFSIVSLLTIFSIYFLFRIPERKTPRRKLVNAHLSWIYFAVLFPVVALTNPRTFHNIFNGTTYEEYVRTRYPLDEGTELVNKYKPASENSRKCADEYFQSAEQSEKNRSYSEALREYNKSIDLNPDNAKPIYKRGLLKLTKLEIDRETAQSAYNDFTRAIQLDSTLAVAYYHRAVVYNYLYKKDRLPAQKDYRKAQELDTSFNNDKIIKAFLALPAIDSSTDTTTYVKLDDGEGE
jgi:tetratricopeptide (TPR) repeat protein